MRWQRLDDGPTGLVEAFLTVQSSSDDATVERLPDGSSMRLISPEFRTGLPGAETSVIGTIVCPPYAGGEHNATQSNVQRPHRYPRLHKKRCVSAGERGTYRGKRNRLWITGVVHVHDLSTARAHPRLPMIRTCADLDEAAVRTALVPAARNVVRCVVCAAVLASSAPMA